MESGLEFIVLGGECFWCLDATYRLVKGVTDVTSGYAGGSTDKPTYEQVSTGATGHAEVVKLEFNPKIISLKDILDIFWAQHDPTTPNRQGNDIGPQYRSVIFYSNPSQRKLIDESLDGAKKVWGDKIVTEIKPLNKFYPAEETHQDFFEKYPEQAYCQVIINPKLEKLRKKFVDLLKA